MNGSLFLDDLWARENLGGVLGGNSGEGNCKSKIVARQCGDNSCGALGECKVSQRWGRIGEDETEVPKRCLPRRKALQNKCFLRW